MADVLKAPFPWFGGKSRVAAEVWARFGDVPNYVEPFFGSGAVLLGRPHGPGIETVNDKDGFVANFWRAVAADSAGVAEAADWPVNENDLHARHAWRRGWRGIRCITTCGSRGGGFGGSAAGLGRVGAGAMGLGAWWRGAW